MVMKSTDAVSGTFGRLIHDGQWLTNVYGVEVNGEINYEDVKRSGTRAKGKKAIDYEFTGTIKSYKMSNEFAKKIGQITDDTKGAFVTELIVALEDPENAPVGAEKIRIKGVQFTNIPVINFEHGSLVEEELQFVCEGYEYITI